jgi:hypothetical protein
MKNTLQNRIFVREREKRTRLPSNMSLIRLIMKVRPPDEVHKKLVGTRFQI